MAVACLSDGELQRFVAGRASVAEQSALAAHLDQCDACRQRLDAFGRDRPDVAAVFLRLP